MNSWYMKYAAMILSTLAGYAAYQWVPWCKMGAAEWASWVQAVGSIAAIVGAYYIGERQAKANMQMTFQAQALAHRKKQAAYLAIASAARDEVQKLNEWFKGDRKNWISLAHAYNDEKFSALISAMSAVPLHDVGSAAAVNAWILQKNAVGYFNRDVSDYLTKIGSAKVRESQSGLQHLDDLASQIMVISGAVLKQYTLLEEGMEQE